MDYKKVGLKAGLEIHQQLNTHKLFCSCPSILRNDEPDFYVERKMNPVVGETGELDKAVSYETLRDNTFKYRVYDSNCLVELDEEPPHEINKEALKIALQIAVLLNCEIFPVTQIMRKTVVDGSNTSGFQRTVLIGHHGYIDTSEGKVNIETIALEEDSARKVGEEGCIKEYNLDRLGIPLVEITTAPDLKSPKQIKEAALKIGEILRACNVKRGLGTIRQDVNISIRGGERIEIKGFQDPRIMLETVEKEVSRQENILKMQTKLSKFHADRLKDLTLFFKDTECRFIEEALKKGDKVFGFKVPGFLGILGTELQPGKRLATDFSDYAKPIAKIGGIIHSDENLQKYSFLDIEIDGINKKLSLEKKDAFILIVGSLEKTKVAREQIIQRAKMLAMGVPKEVRQSLPDGTTCFLRPMPGAARMYPETDLPLLKISKKEIDWAKNNKPKLASENKKYLKEFGLNDELVKLLLKRKKVEEFSELVSVSDYYSLAANMLLIYPKEFAKKEGKSLSEIEEILHMDILVSILEKVPEEISPNDVKRIMYDLIKGKSLEQALEKKDVDLESEIHSLLSEKPGLTIGAYMGLLMNKFSGMVSGKDISDELRKQLK